MFDGLTSYHPLYKYSAWAGIPTVPGVAQNEGINTLQQGSWNDTITILFARQDWFPEPVLVETFGWDDGKPDGSQDSDWSSKPLTHLQWARIKRSVNGGMIVVVPYGDVKYLDMANILTDTVLDVQLNFDTLLSDASYTDWSADGTFDLLGYGAYQFRVVNDVPFGA